MNKKIEISGNGSSLSIKVNGYENPRAQNSHDANWLRCSVSLLGERFSAQFDAFFTTHDFFNFADELRKILNDLTGQAIFVCDEDAFHIKIEFTKTGAANVETIAKIYTQTKLMIIFSFASDPTFLGRTLEELDDLMQEYPIKN